MVLLALSGGFLFVSGVWIARICISYYFLKRERATYKALLSTLPSMAILLPVLNERKRLQEFIAYFDRYILSVCPTAKLFIITTEREREDNPSLETWTIADGATTNHGCIQRIHYPRKQGKMAHQLNWAIDQLPAFDLYAVYNADSRPEPKTFGWVAQQDYVESPKLFQQYGIYTKNLTSMAKQPFAPILEANAYWQNRWSFGFEYYRAKAAFLRQSLPRVVQPFNYCIGHGLIINHAAMRTLRFREDTVNEDAVLGLEAYVKDIPIVPVPYFDIADSPDMVHSMYLQKSSWFFGPLQAPLYVLYLIRHLPRHKIKIITAATKLFSHALYWVAGPMLALSTIVLAIICSMHFREPILLLTILAPLFFLVIPTVLSSYLFAKLDIAYGGKLFDHPLRQVGVLLIGALTGYLIHGAAALRSIIYYYPLTRGVKAKTAMTET